MNFESLNSWIMNFWQIISQTFAVKFVFSRKATKVDEIFTVDLTVRIKCQIDGEDFVKFCGPLRKHELYLSMYLQDARWEKEKKITTLTASNYCASILKCAKAWTKGIMSRLWKFHASETAALTNYIWRNIMDTTPTLLKFRYCEKAMKFEKNLPPFFEITYLLT